jgi:hypothetical protein
MCLLGSGIAPPLDDAATTETFGRLIAQLAAEYYSVSDARDLPMLSRLSREWRRTAGSQPRIADELRREAVAAGTVRIDPRLDRREEPPELITRAGSDPLPSSSVEETKASASPIPLLGRNALRE